MSSDAKAVQFRTVGGTGSPATRHPTYGSPISYSLQTGDIEAGDGTDLLHGKKILPNYTRISGTHSVSVECRDRPNRAARTKGPFNLTSGTEQISVRTRGCTLRLLFAGSSDFRLGRWRFRTTTHGQKA